MPSSLATVSSWQPELYASDYTIASRTGANGFAEPRFYEAQAVVLSNMGSHKQALDIYVFRMQDYTKAEEYAAFLFHRAQSESDPLLVTATAFTSFRARSAGLLPPHLAELLPVHHRPIAGT